MKEVTESFQCPIFRRENYCLLDDCSYFSQKRCVFEEQREKKKAAKKKDPGQHNKRKVKSLRGKNGT